MQKNATYISYAIDYTNHQLKNYKPLHIRILLYL